MDLVINKKGLAIFWVLFLMLIHLQAQPVKKEEAKPIPVTRENYVRAETHRTFRSYAAMGGFSKFFHLCSVAPIDKQDVVRMNRDTRYSIGIFDLTKPLSVTLPGAQGRYISMQVINEEEYTKSVVYTPGVHTFYREQVGSRYVCLFVRILVNGEDENDNRIVSALQDKIVA